MLGRHMKSMCRSWQSEVARTELGLSKGSEGSIG